MILNALDVDPQKQFKGPWRYYSQEMLDCCRTLDDVAKSGITLAEFACLARCNGLREYTRYGTMVSMAEFEREIEKVCGAEGEGSVMAVSYSRKALGQTGSGHFSPIGGYCKSSKRVLVMDVARFKYPSYWVTLEDLFNSLTPVDAATGQPRGFSVLRKSSSLSPNTSPTSGLFSLNFNKQTWPAFLRELRSIASASSPETIVEQVVQLLHKSGAQPVQSRTITPESIALAEADQQLDPVPMKLMTDLYDAEVRSLISVLRPTPLWKLVDSALRAHPPPFPYASPYPQVLGYALFLQSLLTSVASPQDMRHAFHAAVQSHDLLVGESAERAGKEIRFLQDQASSLSVCCSSEKECGCMGKGLPDITSKA